jgi:hypothetical protein
MIKRLIRKIAAVASPGAIAAQVPVDGEILLNRAVIVHVSGGLANQMICYRVGRMLAIANGAMLVLDNHWFRQLVTDSPRNYQLHHFTICPDVSVFSDAAIKNILRNNPVEVIEREHMPESPATEISELFRLFGVRRIIFFDFWGAWHLCWLAERFFEKNDMLSELTLNRDTELEERDRRFLKHIEAARNPVAIHVRRGDYATHDGGLLLSRDYYNQSIRRMEDSLADPAFFVFSDDPAWCKENLVASAPLHHADWNTDSTGYRDLFLASQCRHFILSNESTFSHTIVYLSPQHPDRIVITSTMNDILRGKPSGK